MRLHRPTILKQHKEHKNLVLLERPPTHGEGHFSFITNANKKHEQRPVLHPPLETNNLWVWIYLNICIHEAGDGEMRVFLPHCRGASCRCPSMSWLRTPSTLASPWRWRDECTFGQGKRGLSVAPKTAILNTDAHLIRTSYDSLPYWPLSCFSWKHSQNNATPCFLH